MAGRIFLIISIILVIQLFGLGLCYSSPIPNDNPAYQQLAVQENITATDLFHTLLAPNADIIDRLIHIIKWFITYVSMTITILTFYFHFLFTRRAEDEDWLALKES